MRVRTRSLYANQLLCRAESTVVYSSCELLPRAAVNAIVAPELTKAIVQLTIGEGC